MFDWFFYIVAAVLAAPVVAVIALVRSVQLNKRLHGIELKLAMLERQPAPAVSSPPQAVARPPAAPPVALSSISLLGYGLPAALAIVLALIARTIRPLPYRIVAALTSVILALFYFTLEVRRIFHGPALAGITSDAEQYTYSTVWLMFGIALLAVGVVLRSQPARFLALGVIALTIAKVFLFDTANVAGIYRALSVTGLGVVLLGIGWLYQRVLFPEAAAPRDGARLLWRRQNLLRERGPQRWSRIGGRRRRRAIRLGPIADQMAARIALVEVAIGKAQAG